MTCQFSTNHYYAFINGTFYKSDHAWFHYIYLKIKKHKDMSAGNYGIPKFFEEYFVINSKS